MLCAEITRTQLLYLQELAADIRATIEALSEQVDLAMFYQVCRYDYSTDGQILQ